MNIFNIENKIFCIRIELFDLCLIYEISVYILYYILLINIVFIKYFILIFKYYLLNIIY